jgi:hypothetical protein
LSCNSPDMNLVGKGRIMMVIIAEGEHAYDCKKYIHPSITKRSTYFAKMSSQLPWGV